MVLCVLLSKAIRWERHMRKHALNFGRDVVKGETSLIKGRPRLNKREAKGSSSDEKLTHKSELRGDLVYASIQRQSTVVHILARNAAFMTNGDRCSTLYSSGR